MGSLGNSLYLEEPVLVASFIGWQNLDISNIENRTNNFIIETPKSPSSESNEVRRGRPKSDSITSLILSGTTSRSTIKCEVCYRVFPRLKSLQAHSRTHTGEKPYLCDFPGCKSKFTQSGQLKTHIRLHAGDKPYVCPKQGCDVRFVHPNRVCSQHPTKTTRQDLDHVDIGQILNENRPENEREWINKYWENKRKNLAKDKKNVRARIASDISSSGLKSNNPGENPVSKRMRMHEDEQSSGFESSCSVNEDSVSESSPSPKLPNKSFDSIKSVIQFDKVPKLETTKRQECKYVSVIQKPVNSLVPISLLYNDKRYQEKSDIEKCAIITLLELFGGK